MPTIRVGPRRHAFTLIELLIVLSVLAMLLALAWPQLTRQAQDARLREVAQEVKAAVVEARLGAIETGEAWGCAQLAPQFRAGGGAGAPAAIGSGAGGPDGRAP